MLRTIILQLLLSTLFFSNFVFAENTELNPLTVIATRLDDEVAHTPKNITIITSDQIEQSPAKTIPELLSLEAGILSRSLFGNSAVRSTIDIRGFGASSTQNTLILLDGRRLNDIDLSSINYTAIPIHNIERIEIIRGSGGVFYGDGAVGGVINLITKRAQAGENTGIVKASYGSYATSQFEGAVTSGTEKYGINIAANFIDSNGYRNNNDLRQKNIQADIRRDHNGGELFLKAGASDQNLGLSGNRTVDPTIGLDELGDDRQGTNTANDFADEDSQFITIGVKQNFNNSIDAIIDIGYRHKNQTAFFDDYVGFPPFLPAGSFASFLDTDLGVWSLTPRVNIDGNYLSLNHHMTFGVDAYYYDYESDRTLNEGSISTPIHTLGVKQQSYAIYANDLVDITSRTHLEFGIRLQHVSQDAVDDFDGTAPGAVNNFESEAADLKRNNTEELYNIGLKQYFTDEISIFGNFGRSVRFGTVDELFQFNGLFVREFSIIEPQTAKHVDIGINYQAEKISGSISAYYMDLKNEIHFDPTTFTNLNLDPTERKGLETMIELRPVHSFSIRGNYAYLNSEFDEGPFAGNDVPLVPKHTASLSANWDINSVFTISSIWRYVGEKRFDNDQTNDFGQKIPDYDMWDLKLTSDYQGWTADLAVNNILDEEAFDFGVRSTFTAGRYNGQPLVERNFTLSIAYNFN
ncbi:MAG: TonB-dependent receptor [Proteobacteria bacterium]|nr:TonB-dependent receptor [Pseudomonadota bacterium]